MAKPALDSLSIAPASNGGFTVSHRYKPKAMYMKGANGGFGMSAAPEPEEHVFGSDEHGQMMTHVAKTLGLEQAKEEIREAKAGGPRMSYKGTGIGHEV